MNVLVIGGTGRLGALVAEVAGARGHDVTAFGRSAVGGIVGDATDPAAIAAAVRGRDAVVIALSVPRAGPSPWARVVGPPDLHSRSARLVVDAMAQGRLIKVSAQGVGASAARAGWGFRALVAASNLRPAFADHDVADEIVRRSHLAWTVVHPPRLSDDAGEGPLRAGEQVTTGTFTTVSRLRLATWIVEALDDPRWNGRAVSVAPR